MFPSPRSWKKKSLTDSVVILDFKGQSLRKEKKKPPYLKPESKISSPEAIPKIKKIQKPIGTSKNAHLSILSLLEKEKEKGKHDKNNLPKDSFTQDQLNMLWRKYAFMMKEKGMETFHSALTKRFPVKKGDNYVFEFEVDNEIQKDYIHTHLDEFHEFLRKSLNNFSLKIELFLTKEENHPPKFLNGKEKFEILAKKNTNLNYLKKSLDLDLDF